MPYFDLWSAFPAESAALEADLDCIDDWAAIELRCNAERNMFRKLLRFALTDDVGTTYEQSEFRRSGGFSDSPSESNGEASFRPSLPGSAS